MQFLSYNMCSFVWSLNVLRILPEVHSANMGINHAQGGRLNEGKKNGKF